MKNLFVIVAIAAIFSLNACTTTGKEVPAKVKSAFSQKFPNAKKIKWDKENDNEWEAEFKMNDNEYSANFSSDGTWTETEYEIEMSEIPSLVKVTLDKEFAGYDIEEAEIKLNPDGEFYEFELENDDSKMEVVISMDGTVTKKKMEDEKAEGDDD
jgi:outer membrane biogenesis lipoprotein LolB